MAPSSNIETLNALSPAEHRKKFWECDASITDIHNGMSNCYGISLETSSTISQADFRACFDLIANTSAADYENSSIGWSPTRKRREMRLPDLRYILLNKKSQEEQQGEASKVGGFLSFMLTYEDGYEVVYCYEIHLSAELHGIGLGKSLMGLMEEVGKKARVEKSMLTVFRANKAAMNFYRGLGYEEDEYSPRPRKLRGGVVKHLDYIILSKPLAARGKSSNRSIGLHKKRKTG